MIYIPDADYQKLQTSLSQSFGSEIDCSSNYCKFAKDCKDVTIKAEGDFAITFIDDTH